MLPLMGLREGFKVSKLWKKSLAIGMTLPVLSPVRLLSLLWGWGLLNSCKMERNENPTKKNVTFMSMSRI